MCFSRHLRSEKKSTKGESHPAVAFVIVTGDNISDSFSSFVLTQVTVPQATPI